MNRYPSNRPIVRTILSAAALLIAASAGAAAQDGYPSRTIKIIVPFPAGGTLDVLTRIVGERLAAKWGQPVVAISAPRPPPAPSPTAIRCSPRLLRGS